MMQIKDLYIGCTIYEVLETMIHERTITSIAYNNRDEVDIRDGIILICSDGCDDKVVPVLYYDDKEEFEFLDYGLYIDKNEAIECLERKVAKLVQDAKENLKAYKSNL